MEEASLKREIRWFGSFSMGFADVGADVFVAVGLVFLYAAGASPLAFLLASVTYICTAMAYGELTSMYPYAGGAHVYAMKGFNDFWGFLAGWTVMLDYTIDIALFAMASAGYAAVLVPGLVTGSLGVALGPLVLQVSLLQVFAASLILCLIVLNLLGIRGSSFFNEFFVAAVIVLEVFLLVAGFAFVFRWETLLQNLAVVGAPAPHQEIAYLPGMGSVPQQNFVYGITLAMISFIGIESIAQAAEETRNPTRWIPRAFKLSIISIVVFTIGFAFLGAGMLPWGGLADSYLNPLARMAQEVPMGGGLLALLVGIAGVGICMVSTNTGVVGVSRVTYSMGRFDLMPKFFSRINRRFKTPHVTILLFSLAGLVIALLAPLGLIADLYNFGAILSYMIVHLSLIAIRNKEPEAYRAWKPWGSLRFPYRGRKVEVPFSGLVGFVSTSLIWLLVVAYHPHGRLLGGAWLALGGLLYVLHRRHLGKHLFSTETAKRILPTGYRMNAVLMLRLPESEESVLGSLDEAHLDPRLHLTLLHVLDPAEARGPHAEGLRRAAEQELAALGKRLKSKGFAVATRVETDTVERIAEREANSPDNDLILLLKRGGHKADISKGKMEGLYEVLSRYPGKLMVIRRREHG